MLRSAILLAMVAALLCLTTLPGNDGCDHEAGACARGWDY
jgi:hypothetical protein